MIPCYPEHQIIVILNYGTTGSLLDWGELQISNGKIELEKLVSLLTQNLEEQALVKRPWLNYTDTLSMN